MKPARPTTSFESASLPEIRTLFASRHPTRAERAALLDDPRLGVRALIAALDARRKKEQVAKKAYEARTNYERALWASGVRLVAGCDEAGMSPLAGPVVAAACILDPSDLIAGLDDSKALKAEAREALALEIKARSVAWAVGIASVAEIDALNIRQAGFLARRRAVLALSVRAEHVLVDHFPMPDVGCPHTSITRGDALSVSIGAASILAKTHRDALMTALDELHPGYGFAQHKGYPVRAHVEALERLGVCPEHRRSFAPVRVALEGGPRQLSFL